MKSTSTTNSAERRCTTSQPNQGCSKSFGRTWSSGWSFDPDAILDPERFLPENCPVFIWQVPQSADVRSSIYGFPLVGDPTHVLTKAFGVYIEEEGLALRGTFIINPDGVIKTMEVHDNAIARDVKESLRKLKAAKYVAEHPGEVCPAKWNEGSKTITPSLDLVGKI